MMRVLLPLLLMIAASPLRAEAFPGAAGRAAVTDGGRGGKIVRVTNLGAGLRWAAGV